MFVNTAKILILSTILIGCTTGDHVSELGISIPAPLRRSINDTNSSYAEYNKSNLDQNAKINFQTIDKNDIQTEIINPDVTSYIPKFSSVDSLSLNIENLQLAAFINEVFGNMLKLTFEIDPALSKQKDLVTLRVSQPQTSEALFILAKQVLENYGVSIIPQGDILRFIPSAKAPISDPPLLISGRTLPNVPISHRTIFQLVPLKVVASRQIVPWIQQFYNNPQLKVINLRERNSILLAGSASLVSQVVDVIDFLDRPTMIGNQSIKIEPVFLSAGELSEQLTKVLSNKGYVENESFSLLPIDKTNALIVFASDNQTILEIKKWASIIDEPSFISKKHQSIFFYPVKNTRAEEIAKVLNNLITNIIDDDNNPATSGNQQNNNKPLAKANTNKKLVVDNTRNAILFNGEAEIWSQILPILQEMDIPAKQVLIEVIIAELTLSAQEEYGVEWLLNGLNLSDLSGILASAAPSPIGGSGLTYSLDKAGETRAVLNAFARDNRVSILSSPRIMVKSGESASINVGDEVPIITTQSVSDQTVEGSNGLLQQIQYRSTGIQLTVTPIVHAGRKIDLEIQQSVSNAIQTDTSGVDSPTISNRSISTKLSLSDGSSVLLGGLISSDRSVTESGVPILKDIPLLGTLFKNNSETNTKQELIIMIVPYILNDNEEAKEITEAFRNRTSIQLFEEEPI